MNIAVYRLYPSPALRQHVQRTIRKYRRTGRAPLKTLPRSTLPSRSTPSYEGYDRLKEPGQNPSPRSQPLLRCALFDITWYPRDFQRDHAIIKGFFAFTKPPRVELLNYPTAQACLNLPLGYVMLSLHLLSWTLFIALLTKKPLNSWVDRAIGLLKVRT